MIKKYVTKIFSLILAATMVVSSPMSSYAADAADLLKEDTTSGSSGEEDYFEGTSDYAEASNEESSFIDGADDEGDPTGAANSASSEEDAFSEEDVASKEDSAFEKDELPEDDTDKELINNDGEIITIPINYGYIDYDMETHTGIEAVFPEGSEVPTGVSGRVGETVYFTIPLPTNIPEGCKLQNILCISDSCIYDDVDAEGNVTPNVWHYLHGTFINNKTAERYPYTISEKDIEGGINVSFSYERMIEVVFDDGEHGTHYFGYPGNTQKQYAIGDYLFGSALYPGMSGNPVSDFLYYEPDIGYRFMGLYTSSDLSESSKIFAPGQNGGTPITEEHLAEDGKLHVYAKWEPITAEVILNNNHTKHTVTFGKPFPVIEGQSFTRYMVNDWDYDPVEIIPGETVFDGNMHYSTEAGDYEDDIYFYVYITADNNRFYDVSFETDTLASIAPMKISGGRTVKKPETELTKSGYYLSGWYFDQSFKTPFTFGSTKITRDTTLYAKWDPVKFNVTLHSNYGKDVTEKKTFSIETSEEDKSRKLTELPFFDGARGKEGFKGFATSGTLQTDTDITVEELVTKLLEEYGSSKASVDVSVYALWAPEGQYKIRFEANLPDGSKVSNLEGSFAKAAVRNSASDPWYEDSFNHDELMILSGNEFTLKGFTLTGWKYDKGGKNYSVKPRASVKNLADEGTLTFVAQWKKSSYKITYKLNGGTAGRNKTAITYMADADTYEGIPLYNCEKTGADTYSMVADGKEVKRAGYKFLGWSTADGTFYDHYGDDVYENLVLTAKWEALPYSLEFICSDAAATLPDPIVPVTFEDSFVVKDLAATLPGYTFKGWTGKYKGKNKLFNLKSRFTLKNLDKPEDGKYVLAASFTPNSYKITYVLGGGKIGSKPTSYKTNTGSAKAVSDPKKVGAKFLGWVGVVTDGDSVKVYSLSKINDLIDPDTGKIRAGIHGKVELTAQWNQYTYDIEFEDGNGNKLLSGEDLAGYTGREYTSAVNFTDAARRIESLPSWDGEKSIKGFAIAPGSTSIKYSLYKNYSKLGAKNANGDVLTLYPVAGDKLYRVEYKHEVEGGSVVKPLNTYKAFAKDIKITAKAALKGYTFTGWKPEEGKEDKFILNSAGFVTAIKSTTREDIVLTAEYTPIKYKIMLMPNAEDVREYEGAASFISNRAGKQYIDGETTEFSYITDKKLKTPGWIRTGYTLAGFAASPKSKEPITDLKELGDGKSTTVKLYAIWEPNVHTITYSKEIWLYSPWTGSSYERKDTWGGEETQVYMGEPVTPKTLLASDLGIADYYEFKGWIYLDMDEPLKFDGELEQGNYKYEEDYNFYVRKINKGNDTDITLQAVFMPQTSQINVNNNGGTYVKPVTDELGDSIIAVVQYGDDISAELEAYLNGVERPGYIALYLSTTKDGKNKIELYSTVDGVTKRNTIKAAGTKKYGTYMTTVYPIWKKVTPASAVPSGEVKDGKLTMTASIGAVPGFSQLEFEYSPSPLFLYGVKSVKAYDESSAVTENPQSIYSVSDIAVEQGKEYYVRVRYGTKDSTGNPFYGSYSKAVRASRP